jgi:FMN-dependent NADH-azoreductase
MEDMTKLLHIISSPRGDQSESSRIASSFLDAYLPFAPHVEVDTLDLWDGSLPVYGGRGVEAKMNVFAGQDPEGAAGEAWDDVKRVFDRFAAADEYLITVPMWNHGVPWVLKHLIDTISQPGMLFGFDPAVGYSGLLTGRRAMVVFTSAVWGPGVPIEFGVDFHSNYFRDWLRFAGITDVDEARFQRNLVTAAAEADRLAAERQARDAAARWVASPAQLAA